MIALVGDADVCDIWLLGRKVMSAGTPCQVSAYFHCLTGLLSSYSVRRMMHKMKKEIRTFTPEFKAQMVKFYENGKPRKDIISEYDLTQSALDKWVKQSQTSGSFKEKDNRTPEENELIKLRKENQRLLMENDILKQAALILGESKCDKKQSTQILDISNVRRPTNSKKHILL